MIQHQSVHAEKAEKLINITVSTELKNITIRIYSTVRIILLFFKSFKFRCCPFHLIKKTIYSFLFKRAAFFTFYFIVDFSRKNKIFWWVYCFLRGVQKNPDGFVGPGLITSTLQSPHCLARNIFLGENCLLI